MNTVPPTVTDDIVVVGAPRSGTTWVRAVLSHHPSVVTTVETEVFHALADAVHRWGARRSWRPHTPSGLEAAVSRADLLEWAGGLWWDMRSRMLAARPGTTRVLEKTPHHIEHMDVIREIYGGLRVRFVMLVRDPRAVVRSTLEANVSVPGVFPTSVHAACATYRRQMAAGLASRRDDDTFVVRYEDLERGADGWAPLLAFLGLDDLDLPDLSAAPYDLSGQNTVRLRDDGAMEPGTIESVWPDHSRQRRSVHRDLSPFERRYVDWACADVIDRFGYGASRRRLRADDAARLAVERVRRAVGFVRTGHLP